MKEFDDLISVWKEQKLNTLSVEQVLTGINAKRNKMALKLFFAILAMLFSLVVMLSVWIFLDFEKSTTHLGLSLLVSLVFIYSMMMLRNLFQLRNSNKLLSPKEHIVQLKRIKQDQQKMTNIYMKIYFIILLVGLLLYYHEVLAEASMSLKIGAYSITIAWMVYAQFVLGKKQSVKNNAKLDEMISSLENIENQL